jgi:hypothetical protein
MMHFLLRAGHVLRLAIGLVLTVCLLGGILLDITGIHPLVPAYFP